MKNLDAIAVSTNDYPLKVLCFEHGVNELIVIKDSKDKIHVLKLYGYKFNISNKAYNLNDFMIIH